MDSILDRPADNQDGHERIFADSFTVYPTDYELIPYADRDSWALTVRNGHAWGWYIAPGLGMSGSGMVLDRDGQRTFEVRGDEANQSRRWPRDVALAIALDIVDNKHAVMGTTAAQAIANRDAILASFERPGGDA